MSEAAWQVATILDNAFVFADMVGASSVTLVDEFTPSSDGTHALRFAVGEVEFQMLAPTLDPATERAALLREIADQANVIDKQLDVLDPDGAGFLIKSRNWYRRKKRKADAIDPAATLLCGERILSRLRLMKRLKELNTMLEGKP